MDIALNDAVQTSAKHWSEYFFIGRIEVLLLVAFSCNCIVRYWKALKQWCKGLLQINCLSWAAFLLAVFVFVFVFTIFVFPL